MNRFDYSTMASFKNILIHVDSLYQAQIAAEKAIELVNSQATTLHLVALIRHDNWWQRLLYTEVIIKRQSHLSKRKKVAEKKLAALQERIHSIDPTIPIKTMILAETVINEQLLRYTQEQEIDLMIDTNKRSSAAFDLFRTDIAEDLARKANLAVLTVTRGCLNHPIKSIVLPVTDFVPERKIDMALSFAKKFNAHIHLVTLLNNNDVDTKIRIDAFYLTYKILTEFGQSPQYKILHGADSGQVLLRYANQVKADMILVNPEKKKLLPVFFKGKITDMLPPLSALHILTLKPYLRRTL
jgi:nucleotide-binding universal stress UspA family protein